MKATTCLLRHLPTTRSKTTAFVGLGRMGHEMALNLFTKRVDECPDHHFAICDALPEASKAFYDKFSLKFPAVPLKIMASPAEAASAAQTLITMLPSSPQVSSVYTSEAGIISALRGLSDSETSATICIDSTTLDIIVARDVAKAVQLTGAQMIDAPVSGGVIGAQAATLSFLVGGTSAAFESAHPILSLMGRRIMHCGPSGAGLGAKICNNLVLGVQQVVVAEAMLLGQNLGLDPSVLADVINSSTGGCWASSANNPVPASLPGKSPPSARDYEGGFATSLMLKDLGLAIDSAASVGTPLPLGRAAEAIYTQAIEQQPELNRKDFSSIYRFLQSNQASR